jgi:ribosomal protein L7/L12
MTAVESPVGDGVYRALLIGNSTFPDDRHNLFELKGPVNDLPLLRAALTDPDVGLFEPANVRSLPERSKLEITTAIEDLFNSAGPADTVLLYYSGHGRINEFDNLFLCARDTRTDRLVSTGISDAEVDAMMRSSSARRFVVILDCCHSGAFKSGGGVPTKLRGSGRFLITSSRESELSRDAERQHETSAFTRHLVDGLRDAADHNGDGFVSVNEIYDHVHAKLQEDTQQIPQRHFGKTIGDVALARRLAGVKVEPAPAPASGERPRLSVSPAKIDLHDVQPDEELPVEIIDVFNEGGGDLDWTASANVPWITIVEHDTYAELTLKPGCGRNRGVVRIRDSGQGGSQIVRVFVHVLEDEVRPKLVVTPSELDFDSLRVGSESPPRTLLIHDTAKGPTTARIVATAPEIQVAQLDDVVTVRIDTAKAGQIAGDIVVRTTHGAVVVPVRARVEADPTPEVAPPVVDVPAKTTTEALPPAEDRLDVVLDDPGEAKIAVIKVVRALGMQGLAEAKALVESPPATVLEAVGATEANAAADRLREAGAAVRVVGASREPAVPAARPRTQRYDVVLLSVAQKAGRKTHLVPLIRDVTGLTLKESTRLVDSAPSVIRSGLHQPEAEFLVKQLEKVKGRAEVKPSAGASWSRTSLFRLASQKLRENGAYPLQAMSLGVRVPAGATKAPEALERIKLHLIALSARLDDDEQVHNLALSSLDWNDGILAVSDRRLIFVRFAAPGPSFDTTEMPYEEVSGISDAFTVSSGKLSVNVPGTIKGISKILPSARKNEILNYVRRKLAG